MGGAVSAGHDHDDLIDKLKNANYVKTPSVEGVYRAVDRAFYFLPECQDSAYKDLAWKKGNIHLSAPCIYAEVLENLSLEPGLSFLNLGSGTGYLSTMVGLVLGPYGVNHGVELYEDVIEYAHKRLDEFKKTAPALDCFEFCEPHFVRGNSMLLPSDARQYDRVYCGAACPENHENYMKNLLKVGGILVMPLNDKLMQITRKSETDWESKSVLSVSFSTLQIPQPNDPTSEKLVALPEINPLTLQEICRSVIRTLLRKEAEEEHSNITIRRRKYYRNKRRRVLPNLIIPILDSSDDENELGRNNIFVPAGLRNIGCVIDIAPTIGGGRRGYRMAPVHAIAPRMREGEDGFAVEEDGDPEDPPTPPAVEEDPPAAGESSSSGVSSQNTLPPYREWYADEDDWINEGPSDRTNALYWKEESGNDNDETEEDAADSHPEDSSSEAEASLPRAAKREKVDSGVDGDLEGVEPNPDSPFVSMDSDDSTCSFPEGDDGRMDVESEDSGTPSQRKSPRPDDSPNVPLYSDVMREKIMALSLPPTLKKFLNLDRPF